MITEEQRARIRRLYFAEHWKIGTIAAELGLHHETVRRELDTDRFVQATASTRPSMLDEHYAFVELTLKEHGKLRATRLFEMLKSRGYKGSVRQLRRLVRRLRPRPAAEAFLRLTTHPGEQAQVDWGHFGKIRIGNVDRPLWCFVMVLSWSRAVWARFVLDPQMEGFLRCHQQAFQALGGVPRVVLYDNLKSVVIDRLGDKVRFNDKVLEFAGHFAYDPRPCAPYRGNEKGRVERRIRDLRESFFAARTFHSLDDLNGQLDQWIRDIAMERRVPGERELLVREAYATEASKLLPLPQKEFPCEHVTIKSSGKTPYLRFDRNDYSIPHTLVRKPLTLVASDSVVRVLDGVQEVARHDRSWQAGRVIESEEHIRALATAKRAAAVLRGRDRLQASCKSAEAFLSTLLERRFSMGFQTARLIKLLDLHGADALDRALSEVVQRGAGDVAAVAHVLDRDMRARGVAPPIAPALPDDPRITEARIRPHDLSAYDNLVPAKVQP